MDDGRGRRVGGRRRYGHGEMLARRARPLCHVPPTAAFCPPPGPHEGAVTGAGQQATADLLTPLCLGRYEGGPDRSPCSCPPVELPKRGGLVGSGDHRTVACRAGKCDKVLPVRKVGPPRSVPAGTVTSSQKPSASVHQ